MYVVFLERVVFALQISIMCLIVEVTVVVFWIGAHNGPIQLLLIQREAG